MPCNVATCHLFFDNRIHPHTRTRHVLHVRHAPTLAGINCYIIKQPNMKKITSTMLRDVYTTRDNGDDTERIVYSDVYLRAPDNTTEHDVYEIASGIAHGLGVTHDFSYEIVSRAVDVLAEAYNNADDIETFDVDDLAEDIDAIVPVYYHDLLLIATPGNYHHIDEASEVFGNDIDTIQACAAAWYSLIENATRQLHDAIISYNDND